MFTGIKIGLTDWKNKLIQTKPSVCEVYFRLDKKEEYQEMFNFLQKNKISTGLHFWGFLPGNYLPNLAFADSQIALASKKLLKQTIDIASQRHFSYVNFHPGSFFLAKVDFEKLCFIPTKKQSSFSEGKKFLLRNALELNDYAKKRGVDFLLETITCRDPENWYHAQGRQKTFNLKNVSVKILVKLSQKGIKICNDMNHTLMDEISADKDFLWQKLIEKTKFLLPMTKVVHLNTMIPPFNGTDSHHGFTAEDYQIGAFPPKEKIIEFLKLFQNKDVWIIPEPYKNHRKNYQIIKEMIKLTEKEAEWKN